MVVGGDSTTGRMPFVEGPVSVTRGKACSFWLLSENETPSMHLAATYVDLDLTDSSNPIVNPHSKEDHK